MAIRLGVLTVGESPRPDGLAADVQAALGPGFQAIERGALDGLTEADLAALAPGPGDDVIVSLNAAGRSVQVTKARAVPLLQRQIDRLEAEEGVAGTLLMCTGAFPPLRHSRLLLQPQAALYLSVLGLAAGGPPASLIPLSVQREQARHNWTERGAPGAVIEVADPYGPDPVAAVAAGARRARSRGAQALLLDCFGYNQLMKEAARSAFGGPVVLARSMAARLLAELAT